MKRIFFLATIILALGLSSCLEGPHPLLPELKTLEPTDITFRTVVLRGMVGTEKDLSEDESEAYPQQIQVKFIIADNPDFNPEGWIFQTSGFNAIIGTEVSQEFYGLEADKTYYYKMVYAGGKDPNEDVSHLWNVVSFKTPDYTSLVVGNAVLAGTSLYPKNYNCNIILTSGTMSGKKEEYLNCKVSNGVLNPEIIVKATGLNGTMYTFAKYSNKYGFYGEYKGNSTNETIDVIDAETLHFKNLDPTWNMYICSSDNFDMRQDLRATMAEIQLQVSRKYGEYAYVGLEDLTKSNKIFDSGSLNLSTGKWTIDKDSSQQLNYKTVVADDGMRGSYNILYFYYPPTEFGSDELRLTSSYGNLTLPAGKWEAGRLYKYTLRK